MYCRDYIGTVFPHNSPLRTNKFMCWRAWVWVRSGFVGEGRQLGFNILCLASRVHQKEYPQTTTPTILRRENVAFERVDRRPDT